MKYTGTIFEDVIISKGISYIDYVADNEIELTEYQYNTIPIPCKQVNGEFVSCEFPKIDAPDGEVIPVGVGQVATGSYVGTNKYGADNPNTLTFPFVPKLVVISLTSSGAGTSNYAGSGVEGGFAWVNGVTTGATYLTKSSGYYGVALVWNDKTLSWYNTSSSPMYQLNKMGETYHYVAIGY